MARLLKANHPTIDGVIKYASVHLLQMTISPTHSINLGGLHTAMNELQVIGAPPVFLYFVVPTNQFAVFANPTPVAVGAHVALPPNVHMLVLDMPLPETAGLKRKVRHRLHHPKGL
jgi:hypothetical protein